MKNKLLALICFAFSSGILAQEVFNMRPDFIPNQLDSNFFYYYVSASYIIPKTETTNFQKSRLREDAQKGSRITKGEVEMVIFPMMRYEKEFHPHASLRVDFSTYGYLSSRFGFGVASRSLNSSVGFFHGNYYRRVTYEANFITRRKRSFENYSLSGFYIQSSSEHANFLFSVAFEKTHNFYSSRLGVRVAEMLRLEEKGSRVRTLETVISYESYTGIGFGLSGELFNKSRLEILWVVPDKIEVQEQARLQNKLNQGALISLSYFVN